MYLYVVYLKTVLVRRTTISSNTVVCAWCWVPVVNNKNVVLVSVGNFVGLEVGRVLFLSVILTHEFVVLEAYIHSSFG